MKLNKKSQQLTLSVVFPAYNEANVLVNTINKVILNLDSFVDSYEIIIAEDGSTDGTNKLATNLAEKNTRIN